MQKHSFLSKYLQITLEYFVIGMTCIYSLPGHIKYKIINLANLYTMQGPTQDFRSGGGGPGSVKTPDFFFKTKTPSQKKGQGGGFIPPPQKKFQGGGGVLASTHKWTVWGIKQFLEGKILKTLYFNT